MKISDFLPAWLLDTSASSVKEVRAKKRAFYEASRESKAIRTFQAAIPAFTGGRSPDADKIYSQYLTYNAQINDDIVAINAKYPAGSVPANVTADLATLVKLQQQLGSIFQTDYADDKATLASFIKDCSDTLNKVSAAYNDAINPAPPSIKQQIANDLAGALAIVSTLQGDITVFNQKLETLQSKSAALNATILSLQTKINDLPKGDQKDKATSDLAKAIDDYGVLQSKILQLTTVLPTLTNLLLNFTGKSGPIDQLTYLASLDSPVQSDLDHANMIVSSMGDAPSQEDAVQSAVDNANSAANAVDRDVATVNRDLNPTPPPPPGRIESGVWYIDWTSWFSSPFKIPDGVNTVNIFVGKISLENGNPTIGGFGNMTPALIAQFTEQCRSHNPPIDVKISIGGGGGNYDHCWEVLTDDNVKDFATAMVNFCHTYGVNGIDFDYEAYGTTDQQRLVGVLIKSVKKQDGALATSLCTNSGFSTWTPYVQNVMDAAVDATTGICAVDRLYVMSYYNPIETEKKWLLQWFDWLHQRYNFIPSQLGVGIDDFDAHAYNPEEMKAFAVDNGFSYCHWAYDPGRSLFDRIVAVFQVVMKNISDSFSFLTAKPKKIQEISKVTFLRAVPTAPLMTPGIGEDPREVS